MQRGLGFAWLPLPLIETLLERGELKPLALPTGATRRVVFYLNFIDGDRLGPAARAFLGEMRHQTLAP